MTSINGASWTQAGSISASSAGATATSANGGSLIYIPAIPGDAGGYEVKSTLTLTASGGTYVQYLRATSNALSGPATASTFYAVELQNPTFVGSGCSATLAVYKSVNAAVTSLGSAVVSCRNGMTVRSVIAHGQFAVFIDNNFSFWAPENSLAGGNAGVGARNTPAGNSIAEVRFGHLDTVAPPQINAQSVATSLFPNRAEMQWQGVVDDANGVGVFMYQVLRDGAYRGNFQTQAGYTDSTLSPSTSYSFSVTSFDFHFNTSTALIIPITTPPAGAIDPRQTGIRPTGAYWGGGGEQIDMRSGNLNFSAPLIKAKGRGGWGATFNLSYNSQFWRKDPSAVWKLGRDVGYGLGFKLQAGSLLPFWNGSIDHYLFTDSTGAEYRLNINTNGVWTSSEAIYISYDSGSNRIYFPDGSFWEMGSTSGGTEEDAGTLYPTRMQDTNGNQILIRYLPGNGLTWINSSARIAEIEDVRAIVCNYCLPGNPNPRTSYVLQYGPAYAGDPISHLVQINNYIGTSESYYISYASNHPLYSPFSPYTSFGSTTFLSDVTNGLGLKTHFDWSTNGGELTKVTFPYGGYLRWTYADMTYTSPSDPANTTLGRTQREVSERYMSSNGTTESRYFIERDAGDTAQGRFVHFKARVHDVGAGNGTDDMVKVYLFNYDPAVWNIGLMNQYDEKVGFNDALFHKTFIWTQDAAGNPYISTATTANYQYDPTKQMKTEQVVDTHGNVTSTKIYDWGNATTPMRTYTNTYLTNANYTSRFIFNRLVSRTVSDGVAQPLTLVTNSYDFGVGGFPTNLHEHDDANYGNYFTTRGNIASSVSFGTTTSMSYDMTGTVLSTTQNGRTVTVIPDSTKNYAVPSVITADGFTTSLGWNSFLGLTSETGANSEVVSISYDTSARPSRTYSPYGAFTDYTYSFSAPWTKTATTNGRWVKTTMDGFGRTIRTEVGDTAGTKSIVDTEYAPCGCSPLGKLKRVSQPYAPGGTVYWTTYTYDARGRTLTVVSPDGASTTNYAYVDHSVTATDPAGKWKTMTMDALGNLTQVVEPNPAGGTFTTNYTYDVLNHLVQVSMPRGTSTQTRTWNYDQSTQRLTSNTNPENGTVSYTYNADSTVATRTDAKGQRLEYTYDTKKRVIQIKKFGNFIQPGNIFGEDTCQGVTFAYDTNTIDPTFSNYTNGRLATMSYSTSYYDPSGTYYCQAITEMYSYTPAGAIAAKRLRVNRYSQGLDLDVVYTFDTEGKVATVTYPNGGPTYQNQYDTMGRLSGMIENVIRDGQPAYVQWVGNVVYGPAGELKQMQWLSDFYYGVIETRTYNSRLQLTGLSSSSNFAYQGFSHSYNYSSTNNNGQIVSMTDNKFGGETVTYAYDALKRLIAASSNTGSWGQSFAYDGFGNMTSQTVTQGSAPSISLLYDNNTNRILTPGYSYDANGNMTHMPGTYNAYTYDASNRMVTAWIASSSGYQQYGYAPDNKRIYVINPDHTEQIHFYGGNQRLGIYTTNVDSDGIWHLTTVSTQKYFGGRKMETMDRVGSDIRGTKYFPYGAEATATANDKDKFATYYRDNSGLDYADQRYYSSTIGRFMSPDPYQASGGFAEPISWNKYAYVIGDPVNNNDKRGLFYAAGHEGDTSPGTGAASDQLFSFFFPLFGSRLTDRDSPLLKVDDGENSQQPPLVVKCSDDVKATQQTFDGLDSSILDIAHKAGLSEDFMSTLGDLIGKTIAKSMSDPDNIEVRGGHINLRLEADQVQAAVTDSSTGNSQFGLLKKIFSGATFGNRTDVGAVTMHSGFDPIDNKTLFFHFDLYNPKDDLTGLLGHFFVDVLGGHIGSPCLDPAFK